MMQTLIVKTQPMQYSRNLKRKFYGTQMKLQMRKISEKHLSINRKNVKTIFCKTQIVRQIMGNMNHLETSTRDNNVQKIQSTGMIEMYVGNARVLNDTCIS